MTTTNNINKISYHGIEFLQELRDLVGLIDSEVFIPDNPPREFIPLTVDEYIAASKTLGSTLGSANTASWTVNTVTQARNGQMYHGVQMCVPPALKVDNTLVTRLFYSEEEVSVKLVTIQTELRAMINSPMKTVNDAGTHFTCIQAYVDGNDDGGYNLAVLFFHATPTGTRPCWYRSPIEKPEHFDGFKVWLAPITEEHLSAVLVQEVAPGIVNVLGSMCVKMPN